jgi:quercetin dioxygenase-like cupin family protein
MKDSRALPSDGKLFVDGNLVPSRKVGAIEGAKETGEISFKHLLTSENLLVLEVFRKQGMTDPRHNHPDHDSMCYLLSGRARVVIGDREFIAQEGCAWLHPAGVDHYSEALTDCVQLEVKSPPRRTWD